MSVWKFACGKLRKTCLRTAYTRFCFSYLITISIFLIVYVLERNRLIIFTYFFTFVHPEIQINYHIKWKYNWKKICQIRHALILNSVNKKSYINNVHNQLIHWFQNEIVDFILPTYRCQWRMPFVMQPRRATQILRKILENIYLTNIKARKGFFVVGLLYRIENLNKILW